MLFIAGQQASGATIDLAGALGLVGVASNNYALKFPSLRWARFLTGAGWLRLAGFDGFGRYLCDRSRAVTPPSDPVSRVQMRVTATAISERIAYTTPPPFDAQIDCAAVQQPTRIRQPMLRR